MQCLVSICGLNESMSLEDNRLETGLITLPFLRPSLSITNRVCSIRILGTSIWKQRPSEGTWEKTQAISPQGNSCRNSNCEGDTDVMQTETSM